MTRATVDAKDFAAAISWAARAVPTRPAYPILTAVALTVADGELTATAFDYETHARATVPADGHLDTVYVNGQLLAKLAPQLTGAVTFTLDGSRLQVTAGRDRYKLRIMPADEYPTLPAMPPAVGDSAGFLDAATHAVQSAATDPTIPSFTGVHVEALGGSLKFCATDRYRMSVVEIPWGGQDFAGLVPAKVLHELARALGNAHVTVYADKNRFGITAGNFTVSTVLLDPDRFPPLGAFASHINGARQRAESDNGGIFITPRAELSGVIKRVSLVLDRSQPLRLHLSPDGNCALGASGDDDGDVTLTGTYLGPEHDVYLNDHFLASLVDATSHPYVMIGTPGENRNAVHIAGCADDSGEFDPAVQHVLMTVRVGGQ